MCEHEINFALALFIRDGHLFTFLQNKSFILPKKKKHKSPDEIGFLKIH